MLILNSFSAIREFKLLLEIMKKMARDGYSQEKTFNYLLKFEKELIQLGQKSEKIRVVFNSIRSLAKEFINGVSHGIEILNCGRIWPPEERYPEPSFRPIKAVSSDKSFNINRIDEILSSSSPHTQFYFDSTSFYIDSTIKNFPSHEELYSPRHTKSLSLYKDNSGKYN